MDIKIKEAWVNIGNKQEGFPDLLTVLCSIDDVDYAISGLPKDATRGYVLNYIKENIEEIIKYPKMLIKNLRPELLDEQPRNLEVEIDNLKNRIDVLENTLKIYSQGGL